VRLRFAALPHKVEGWSRERPRGWAEAAQQVAEEGVVQVFLPDDGARGLTP
jgi:hypothetical protein